MWGPHSTVRLTIADAANSAWAAWPAAPATSPSTPTRATRRVLGPPPLLGDENNQLLPPYAGRPAYAPADAWGARGTPWVPQ